MAGAQSADKQQQHLYWIAEICSDVGPFHPSRTESCRRISPRERIPCNPSSNSCFICRAPGSIPASHDNQLVRPLTRPTGRCLLADDDTRVISFCNGGALAWGKGSGVVQYGMGAVGEGHSILWGVHGVLLKEYLLHCNI